MEFVVFLAEHRPIRIGYAFAAFVAIVASGIIAYSAPMGPVLGSPELDGPRVGVRILYFAACSIGLLCSALWVCASKWFARGLMVPFGLWTSGAESPATRRYRSVLRKYARLTWLDPRNCKTTGIGGPEEREGSAFLAPKLLFAGVWGVFFWLSFSSISQMNVGLYGNVFAAAIFTISTFVNGFSYWLCCMYVLFLKDVLGIPGLPHDKTAPASTPEFLALSDNARRTYTFFLAVVLLIAISTMCVIQLLPASLFEPGGNPAFALMCTSSFTLLGVATFLVLFVFSRFFLSAIVGAWRRDAIASLPDPAFADFIDAGRSPDGPAPFSKRKARRAIDQLAYAEARQRVIRGINERPRVAYTDVLSVAIAIATLIVNLATLVGTMGL